jgi:hypothetical protein
MSVLSKSQASTLQHLSLIYNFETDAGKKMLNNPANFPICHQVGETHQNPKFRRCSIWALSMTLNRTRETKSLLNPAYFPDR